MKTQAIIPTAGSGTRLNVDIPKAFVELGGKPLCVYALEAFQESPVIDSVIVVGHKDQLNAMEELVQRYALTKVAKVVSGGNTRCASVARGLEALDPDTAIVVVHDGARPFVSAQIIEKVVSMCRSFEAAVAAVAVTSTIKRADPSELLVEETIDRSNLWEVQTPQAFQRAVLEKAHGRNRDPNPTDDAVMVERIGGKVKIVPGEHANIKITTREDLAMAGMFLRSKTGTRE